jgi:hypothetical protein
VNLKPRLPDHRSSLSGLLALAVAALIATGCASHRDTPRQQFTGALMRGNAAQASYIWNNMSAQDRASFRRGESLKPQIDPATAAAQLLQHQAEDDGQNVSDDPPATVEIPGDAAPAN